MSNGILTWFTDEDYDRAIEWRKKAIEAARIDIVKSQKKIEKLEGEIFYIIESRKQNLDKVENIDSPVLSKPGVSFISKESYNPTWSWFEKARFVLEATKLPASAKDIVLFLSGLDKELRENEKKRRLAQAAIINALKPRIKKGQIGETKTEEGVSLYTITENLNE